MANFKLMSVLLLCLAPFSSWAFPNSFAFEENLSCRDYTLDKCTVELEGLIETVKDIEEEACQQYCDIIYQSRCLFFVYDRKQRTCNLLSEPIDDYANTCKKIAGPKAPSIADCKEVADDPCKVFVEGYCRFEGNLLEHLEMIETVDQCQFACKIVPNCNYFLYDVELMDCELFDSEKRDCDLLRGPPKPAVTDCLEQTTTSEATTVTTTTTTTEETESTTPEEETTIFNDYNDE